MSIDLHLIEALRKAVNAYAPGDQVAPCVLLWPDPERLWQSALPQLQARMPELYQLGDYAPELRVGPALWLRYIEANIDEHKANQGRPIFYLPGISREQLRNIEDCPPALSALVELQYRGAVWIHQNGKEWTPHGYLVSNYGGLALEVAKDHITLDALAGALPTLMTQSIAQLQGRRLNAEFFNALLAPDSIGQLLRWLSEPELFKQSRTAAEWKAFCQQCKTEAGFDPIKDGALTAAKLLATRVNHWQKVWQRFIEAPTNYKGVVEWLKRAAPVAQDMFATAEVWPNLNELAERDLAHALEGLLDRTPNEAVRKLIELDAQHGARRDYPWHALGLTPLADALRPLTQLARLCQSAPGAPDPETYAAFYANEGWRVDAAAIETLVACTTPEKSSAILRLVSSVYLPWLESTARHLQLLIYADGQLTRKRGKPIEPSAGRLVLFADGLRMDIAKQLQEQLRTHGLAATLDWEWSAIPSVTATAKPAASPISGAVQGDSASDEFTTRLIANQKKLDHSRFLACLKDHGWQCLSGESTGDPTGSAWTEAGTLDKRGHHEGWKLAHSVQTEIRDLASRIDALIGAGWQEVIVVTDHGWLLLPGGLPKVELKAFFTETRWSRCAALKPDAQTDTQAFK